MGLHQALCVCTIAISLVFLWNSNCENERLSDSCGCYWDSCPSVGSKVNVIVNALSFYILFCSVWLSSLRSMIFSNEKQEGIWRRERREATGSEEGGKETIRYFV